MRDNINLKFMELLDDSATRLFLSSESFRFIGNARAKGMGRMIPLSCPASCDDNYGAPQGQNDY